MFGKLSTMRSCHWQRMDYCWWQCMRWVLWREGQHHQDEGLLSQSQHETAGAFGHWSGYLVGWNHDSKCRFSIHQNGMLKRPKNGLVSLIPVFICKPWILDKTLGWCFHQILDSLMVCSHLPQRGIYWLRPQLKAGKNPFEVLRNFSEMRGMDFWTDVRDWLGGWPRSFWVAKVAMTLRDDWLGKVATLPTTMFCCFFPLNRPRSTTKTTFG